MRKHGWQLPYHPLQVVAVAVFLALGFAFYVFFLPFVGRKMPEYVLLGLYTPLVACVLFLYVWCAATDPGDPGVFKSKKYLNIEDSSKHNDSKSFKQGSSTRDGHIGVTTEHAVDGRKDSKKLSDQLQKEKSSCCDVPFLIILLGWCPLSLVQCLFPAHEQSAEQHNSEDGMFYCSLCEVEVLKYSKHCRVCDKCVDGFDHHCRWLNNCIGRRNYGRFFILMIFALLLLILQWSIGILVLILCFVERKRFSVEISAKLGSSFSLVPFIIVVASCTFLAMLATLPLAQLFFFHVLLIKKGISTYDYIVALREQEQDQQAIGQQSPQMSSVSSYTGLSSASSFSAFRRDAWCTPPRLFLEDQFDVVPPEVSMPSKAIGKKMMLEESAKKRSAGTVKISPWILARMNAEEVSKAAAEAKKKSKILQPVARRENIHDHETDSSFGSGSGRIVPSLDSKRKTIKRGRLGSDHPLEPVAKTSTRSVQPPEVSTSLAPLQFAARSAFRTSRAMSATGIATSSPDSSLESPDLHPFRVSSSGAEDPRGLVPLPSGVTSAGKGVQLLRSTSSDGYEFKLRGGEQGKKSRSFFVNHLHYLESRQYNTVKTMALVLHTPSNNKNAWKSLIAAEYSGIQVELVKNFQMGVSNKTPEFLKMNPLGKIPVLETPEGAIFESNAIARYVTCLKKGNPLYGSSMIEYGHIEQWMDFAATEVDKNISAWLYPRLGYWPFIHQQAEEFAISNLKRALEALNTHLTSNTFLVGHTVTLADITMTCNLHPGFTGILTKSFTSQYPHVERYFWTLVNQPNFLKVIGEAKQAESIPPVPSKKPAHPKESSKTKEPKKEAKKEPAKPKAEEATLEEEEAPKPKPKNPLDLLPPSTMILDEWKRLYSNTKTNFREVAIKGFWDMYDPEGYSLWFCDYKYNNENTVSFVTLNKVGGFLQRMDLARKYAFGKMLVIGSEPPYKVKGLWLFRGKEVPPFVVEECYDMELYEWTKVDINDDAQKERVNAMIEDQEPFEGEALLDAKCFK